jgi:hypothetical protein
LLLGSSEVSHHQEKQKARANRLVPFVFWFCHSERLLLAQEIPTDFHDLYPEFIEPIGIPHSCSRELNA